MPEELGETLSVDVTLCRTVAWEEYDIRDTAVLEHLFEEHADRRDEIGFPSGFSFREETGEHERVHLFFVDDGTVKTQLYTHAETDDSKFTTEEFVDDEVGRHETIAESRLKALVGRANKTVEIAEYIEQFEEYGVGETVLDRYRQGPVLSGDWLEEAILERHGRSTLEDIPDHLFARPGEYVYDDEAMYEDAVEQVTKGALYDESGAGVLDTEAVTKQRRFSDYYAEGREAEEMQSIYSAVVEGVEMYLEKE
ncbi:MAG: hypothetical protein SVU32_08565 [Candidatus Nanohaloarchaea archaeon]|nr:hypothetical protein [Candidatus Nanohaloarchaea archaeon]